jgi:glycosyltransferase involved in cell wall biosynthesis
VNSEKKAPIDVVVATYNGGRYLKAQLQSICMSEGFSELVNCIIVSDDGSSDNTREIVEGLEVGNVIFRENSNIKGPVGNFFNGLSVSTAEYVMFSDQDDYWEPEKIKRFYESAMKLKGDVPGVVYSDLSIVDKDLAPLEPSFFKSDGIPLEWGRRIGNLALQSGAPGCAVLINKKAIERMMPYHKSILMHDWWALLFGALYQNVRVINAPLVRYRQHGANCVGAFTRPRSIYQVWMKLSDSHRNFRLGVRQARHFYLRLSANEKRRLERMEVEGAKIEFVANLGSASLWERIRGIARYRTFKPVWVKNIVTWAFITCYPRES